jgi:hypothetical protein
MISAPQRWVTILDHNHVHVPHTFTMSFADILAAEHVFSACYFLQNYFRAGFTFTTLLSITKSIR